MAQRAISRPPVELFTRYWLPVLGYLGLVQLLGSRPDFQVPPWFPNVDKAIHVLEYLVLGFLLARAIRASSRNPVPVWTASVAVAMGLCMGVADEFVQSFVPGRMSSVNDVMADAAGLLIAQILFLLVVRE